MRSNIIFPVQRLVYTLEAIALKKFHIQRFANGLQKYNKKKTLGRLRNGVCKVCYYRIVKSFVFPPSRNITVYSYCVLKHGKKHLPKSKAEIHDLDYSCKHFWLNVSYRETHRHLYS